MAVRCLNDGQRFKIIILFCLMCFLFSCENTSKKAKRIFSDRGTENLFLCISSDVSSLDPRYGSDATSSQVIKMLFEGLMCADADGKIAPAIADSFEISSDKKTYIFHLRECQWSNGIDITAYDFEYSWKSVIDIHEKKMSTLVHNFYILKNVSKYLKAECPLDQVGVHALDARTLKVELENPIPYFLEALTNTWFFPVCKVTDQAVPKWSTHVGKPFVCSGPFHLKEHKIDHKILVEKNPLFWNADRVLLKTTSISVIKDAMTRLCLFERGRIDWIGKPLSGLPLDACAILRKENKIHLAPSLGVYWYFFNTDRFPFTNKHMRLAFAYSVNRNEITEYMLQSDEKPAHSILPSVYGLGGEKFLEEDPVAKARFYLELGLKELGLKKENLPELTLSYNTDEIHQNVAQIIQQQIFAVLGIKIKLRHVDWRVHYNNLIHGDFCMGGMMWHSWVRDPIYILQTFRDKDDGINMARWQNEKYRELLLSSEREIDFDRRKRILCQAHELLMEEMPVIPIYFTSIAYAKSDILHNPTVLENSILDFRYAYFSYDDIGTR